MKLILKLLLLFFLYNNVYSQVDTILSDLNSENLKTQMRALYQVQDEKLTEYIPVLEEKLFAQSEPFMTLIIFRTLDLLEAPNMIALSYQLIEYSRNFKNMFPTRDTLYTKVLATKSLLKRGDSNTVSYLFQIIDRDFPSLDPDVIECLLILIRDFEDFENQAKNELIRYSRSGKSNSLRNFCISQLYQSYKEESIPFIKERFETDTYLPILVNSFEKIIENNLIDNEYYFINSLFSHSNPILKTLIADSLLSIYGNPLDLQAVIEYYNNETDSIALMTDYVIKDFKPKKPNFQKPILEFLNNLIELSDSTSNYNWLGDVSFSSELKNILEVAKTNLQNGDSLACRVQVKAFQDLVDNVYKDSLNTDARFVTIEGWKFLYWNAQYILDRLPEPPANPNLVVNLKNSLGNQIPASNVKYYEGSWKDAVNNGDGTFTVITTRATVSIRVFYEYASQQVDNVPAQNNAYTFTTVNAAVQLKNSLGNLIDVGTVQYYAGAWRSFGTTLNGVAYKELLPINYSFRMTYEYGSIDKQQNLSSDPTVVFQTVNTAVQLKNSLGNLIDAGTVQYYAGAWRSFGTTSNGVAYKELLPINYSFRMTYEFVSNDKQQNISTNPVVDFNTVLCSVKVSKTSTNEPINNAAVKYYSGAWRNLGTTNVDGITTKELLPANLSFRATLGSVSLDKQQDISVNNFVEILLNVP
jgi:hypothetical protein